MEGKAGVPSKEKHRKRPRMKGKEAEGWQRSGDGKEWKGKQGREEGKNYGEEETGMLRMR